MMIFDKKGTQNQKDFEFNKMRYTEHESMARRVGHGLVRLALIVLMSACNGASPTAPSRSVPVAIPSLDALSVPALRGRRYASVIAIVGAMAGAAARSADATNCLGRYDSDGLLVYARIDVPTTAPPERGYPVVVFVHGWVGLDQAPGYDFGAGPNSQTTGAAIQGYSEAGFVVVAPGLRGHGTFAGVPADGIEFLAAWDNGSYLSPMFYAIDVLNLLMGLESLADADWAGCGRPGSVSVDLDRLYLSGHSQGGDVALAVLAAVGEGSTAAPPVAAASIWAGTIAPRIVQGQVYHAMQSTPQAFLAGDGTWTGSARGADGSINPNFVFAYPADWIGSVDPAAWTWQHETWSTPSVAAALETKFGEMYDALNRLVRDVEGARFELVTDPTGRVVVRHDPRVSAALERVGGWGYPEFLTEPLALHHSDRDFYSWPEWNAGLCARVNSAGGRCVDFNYPGNTHSFRRSKHEWFADAPVTPALDTVIKRDVALFSGRDPAEIPFP